MSCVENLAFAVELLVLKRTWFKTLSFTNAFTTTTIGMCQKVGEVDDFHFDVEQVSMNPSSSTLDPPRLASSKLQHPKKGKQPRARMTAPEGGKKLRKKRMTAPGSRSAARMNGGEFFISLYLLSLSLSLSAIHLNVERFLTVI